MSYRFPLAPMSPVIKGLTLLVLVLPLIFGIWALISRAPVAAITCLLLIFLYGVVWLGCRPSHFVASHPCLEIVFPLWQRRIPIRDISHVRSISQAAFSQEFGWAIRIGVGGLWGGFGWLWTSRRGVVEFYISQLDHFILIERSAGRCLLITPENPNRFVEVMQEML